MNALLQRFQPLFATIRQAGGAPLIVGGAVRDYLLGLEPKDIDIEVYGLPADQLIEALTPFGRVNAVGRSFGVLKLRMANGEEIDVSLPRRESKAGTGHRGFIVEPDPDMTPQEAAARRDFTWNALAMNPYGTLLDFFGGAADLKTGIIRHVSDAFSEDPLRVLRAMQFAARFDMRMAPETVELCRSLLVEASTLSIERVWGEWSKWALKGKRPSAGLRVLRETGWLTLTPELYALVGCPQHAFYHPEGDVWTHTKYVCDVAAQIAEREQLNDAQRTALLFAALCHDLGKPATTQPDAQGQMRSMGHAKAGAPLALTFLRRIGAPHWLGEQIEPLVREHLAHLKLAVTEPTIRRLAVRLEPSTIAMWGHLLEADHSGRPPLPPGKPATAIIAIARQLGVLNGPPSPILSGRHLLEHGMTPGPALGAALREAYQAQLDGVFTTVSEGLEWMIEHYQPDTDAE
jgi:tRNA nucleotidyltransferase (CCA-adding enzyme)